MGRTCFCLIALCVAANLWAAPWVNDVDTARVQAKASKKLVLVYLYTDWSGWCTKFDKEVLTDRTVQAAIATNCIAVRLNAEKDSRAGKLVREWGAKTYPYVAFLDVAGKPIHEFAGPTDATTFLQELQTAVVKAAAK